MSINGNQMKLTQYAGDTSLILDGSEQSLQESLNLIDIFGDVSGLRLNRKKTEALRIGTKAGSDFQLLPEKGFKWPRNKVKALGVWLSTDPDITISQNYNNKLENINTILGCWKFRRLILLGKITVLKSLLASQLVYLLYKRIVKHSKKLTRSSTTSCAGAIKEIKSSEI